jgi:hypothetical protein
MPHRRVLIAKGIGNEDGEKGNGFLYKLFEDGRIVQGYGVGKGDERVLFYGRRSP